MASSSSFVPLLEPVRPELERVQELLRATVSQTDEPLRSMLSRSLGGGKQLRPALVVLTGQIFDAPPEPLRRLAAAVDMLHSATLIHDDLVDGSPLRRGQSTLHTFWSVGASVLAGDYLLAEATTLVVELENPRVAGLFVGILRTMCAGEIKRMLGDRRDLSLPDRNHVGKWREVYYRDIEAKTASLFAATTEMAAILAGAEEIEVTALRRYGRELGLAFQIVDDVLDLTSDASHLGKPVGSDLRQGTITLPVLCYVEMGERNEVVGGVLRGEREEAQVRAAVEAIRASGAIEAALAEARDHAGRSQEALASLPDNAWRGVLRDLAEYVVRREH